jgi:uncharacterized membrane protein YccC
VSSIVDRVIRRATRGRGLRDLVSSTVTGTRERLRRRGRSGLAWTTRLTAAAIASFVVADLVFPDTVPLLAPLTALLVIQITPVSILRSGLERVISVVLGVSVAIGFTSWVGLTWWSLGTVVALSLLLGQALRLGGNTIEIAISAMLVLGVGTATAESAAWKRIAETLVGAGVGVLSNLVYPPRVTTEDAAAAIEGLGADLARLLESATHDLDDAETSEVLAARAPDWLGQARRITHDIPNVGSALIRAEESRRLNLRALVRSDSGPSLRHGMEALEHSAVAVRSMFRSFVETVQAYDAADRDVPPEVCEAAKQLWTRMATTLRTYGALVRAQVAPEPPSGTLDEHHAAIESLRAARSETSEPLLVDPRDDTTLAALTVFLLATVDRFLQELGVGEPTQRRPPTLARPRWPKLHP